MRSIAASLLFLPVLLSAQAVHSGVAHLVANVDAPAFAFQTSALHGTPSLAAAIIAPVRLTNLHMMPVALTTEGEVTVEYTVDTQGVPQDVHVVKPLNAQADEQVIEAVKQVRYTPGSLHGQTVAMPVVLHVALTK